MGMVSTGQPLPTFLGIGAQKSGTTSIHQYLLSHPQIFLPARKELRFFPFEGDPLRFRGPGDGVIRSKVVTSWSEYRSAFRGSEKYAARGEISPEYLMLAETAAPRILHYLPDVKLFAVLRNPVDRAYSNFQQAVRQGREPLADFQTVLDLENERIRQNWSPLFWYKHNGLYWRQLSEFYARFPRDQIRIYLYDDLSSDAAALMAEIYRFLGVDPRHRPDVSMKYHPSGIPRFRPLYGFLQGVRNRIRFLDRVLPASVRNPIHTAVRDGLLGPAPSMSPIIRKELMEYYREDILRLQDLLRRDLKAWTIAD